MKRINKQELERIKELIKEGKSIKQICRDINRCRTTVWKYFRKIKGRTMIPIVVNEENDELIGEFMGLFAGDGCVYTTNNYCYRTYLCFNTNEEEFVNDLIEKVLLILFKKKPWIFIREHRLTLCYCSKNIHKFIEKYLEWNKEDRKTYSIKLRNQEFSTDFMIGFIRGSLDSDGYLSEKAINFASVSPGLIDNISEFLDNFNFTYSIKKYKEKRPNRKDMCHINIWKKDFNRFLELIKPRNIKGTVCADWDSNS
jgi:hypothetical protein